MEKNTKNSTTSTKVTEEEAQNYFRNRIPKGNDMFENLRRTYLDQLSDEDIKKYEEFGKNFHSIDFVNSGTTNTNGKNEIKLEEALASVVNQLKSGLHCSFLSDEEKCLVEAQYGKEWYKKFGFDTLEL